jgi:hypothetical protein
MNGMDYTSLGLIKFCPQPEILPQLQAHIAYSQRFYGTRCLSGNVEVKLRINARKEELE